MDGLVVAPTAPLPIAYSSSRGEQESFQTSVGVPCTVRYSGDGLGDEMVTSVLSSFARVDSYRIAGTGAVIRYLCFIFYRKRIDWSMKIVETELNAIGYALPM